MIFSYSDSLFRPACYVYTLGKIMGKFCIFSQNIPFLSSKWANYLPILRTKWENLGENIEFP